MPHGDGTSQHLMLLPRGQNLDYQFAVGGDGELILLQDLAHRVPERSCIACGAKREKRNLVRVVRAPDGRVTMDGAGKMAGRGAYLCHDHACWAKGLQRRGHLERALRGAIAPDDRARLQAYARGMTATADVAEAGGEKA